MKKYVLILMLFFLVGCNPINGCPLIQTVSCTPLWGEGSRGGEPWPNFAHYQKSNTLGFTSSEQRQKDIISCGVKKETFTVFNTISSKYFNNGVTWDSMRLCMINKGYIYIPANGCGRSQHPKESSGKCNL